jgi:hypothetical protein
VHVAVRCSALHVFSSLHVRDKTTLSLVAYHECLIALEARQSKSFATAAGKYASLIVCCRAEIALARTQGKKSAGEGSAPTTTIDPEFTRQLWEKVTRTSVSQAENTGLQSSNVAWHRRVCGHCTRCKKVVWEKRNTGCYRKRKPSECVFLPKVRHAVLCCAVLCCAVLCCAVLSCAVLCFVLEWSVDACSCSVDNICTQGLKVLGSVQPDFMCACEAMTSAPCQHSRQDCVNAAFSIKFAIMTTVVMMNIIGMIMMLSL